MKLNVCVLGGGSWGTTLASVVAHNAQTVLWARNSETVHEINEQHTNEKYLPGGKLCKRLLASNSLEYALQDADVVVVAIPSQNFRAVLKEVKPYMRPWIPIVSLTKGLEKDTNLRMTEIIHQEIPGHPVGVLTGPNLAREIISGAAAASVIAMEDPVIVKELQKLFHCGLFRVYTNHDVVGCELGGVLKNVIAIAAGMGDGLGAGDNTRSALLTRGLAEITRLGVALGGEQATFAGLAGMGDLLATCTSPQSRNRTVGFKLGQGMTLEEIQNEMFMVAEGVKSAPTVIKLANERGIQMPIAQEVYVVITGSANPRHAYRGLLTTRVGAESQPG